MRACVCLIRTTFHGKCRLSQNLIDTIRADYLKLYPNAQQQPPPAVGAVPYGVQPAGADADLMHDMCSAIAYYCRNTGFATSVCAPAALLEMMQTVHKNNVCRTGVDRSYAVFHICISVTAIGQHTT